MTCYSEKYRETKLLYYTLLCCIRTKHVITHEYAHETLHKSTRPPIKTLRIQNKQMHNRPLSFNFLLQGRGELNIYSEFVDFRWQSASQTIRDTEGTTPIVYEGGRGAIGPPLGRIDLFFNLILFFLLRWRFRMFSRETIWHSEPILQHLYLLVTEILNNVLENMFSVWMSGYTVDTSSKMKM